MSQLHVKAHYIVEFSVGARTRVCIYSIRAWKAILEERISIKKRSHMLSSIFHFSAHVSANISIHLSFSVLRSCRIYGFHIHIMIVHRYLYYQGFRHLKKPCYEQSVHASYKYLRVNPCMHVCSPNCMHMRNILYRPCVVV